MSNIREDVMWGDVEEDFGRCGCVVRRRYDINKLASALRIPKEQTVNVYYLDRNGKGNIVYREILIRSSGTRIILEDANGIPRHFVGGRFFNTGEFMLQMDGGFLVKVVSKQPKPPIPLNIVRQWPEELLEIQMQVFNDNDIKWKELPKLCSANTRFPHRAYELQHVFERRQHLCAVFVGENDIGKLDLGSGTPLYINPCAHRLDFRVCCYSFRSHTWAEGHGKENSHLTHTLLPKLHTSLVIINGQYRPQDIQLLAARSGRLFAVTRNARSGSIEVLSWVEEIFDWGVTSSPYLESYDSFCAWALGWDMILVLANVRSTDECGWFVVKRNESGRPFVHSHGKLGNIPYGARFALVTNLLPEA